MKFLNKHCETGWSNWLNLPEVVKDIYDLHEIFKVLGKQTIGNASFDLIEYTIELIKLFRSFFVDLNEMTEIFRKNDMNINQKNLTGWTILHGAAFFGKFQFLALITCMR